jgi:hypothetical protein
MSDLYKAAQQALLEMGANIYNMDVHHDDYFEAMEALRAALAQQEQEPYVAYSVDWGRDGDRPCCTIIKRHANGTHELVAVKYGPPRREWVPLTEDDFPAIRDGDTAFRSGALWADRLLKEKNLG